MTKGVLAIAMGRPPLGGGGRAVRATAAAVWPGAVRGARGRTASGGVTGVLWNVVKNDSSKYKEKTKTIYKNHGFTCALSYMFMFYQNTKMIPGSISTLWYKRFTKNIETRKAQKKPYMSQKQLPKTQRLICPQDTE